MKRKVQFLTSILLLILFIQGCGERPPDPVATPDATEAAIMEDLYNESNNPASTSQVLTLIQERSPESQRTIIGLFSDGFLQRRGFGLGPERMELLKSMLAMYHSGIDVDEVLGISRELPEENSAQFAFLPERTIVVLANEITTIWDSENSLKFANDLSSVFEQTGIEPDTVNALVRSMEIRDFMNKLELANSGDIPAQSQAQATTTFSDRDLGISFDYPKEWKEELLLDGMGVISPAGTTAVTIKKLELDETPQAIITGFTESSKGSNPYLKYEDSQTAKMVKDADSAEGIQVVKQFSYPSGKETFYLTDIAAIQDGGTNWILLITRDQEDEKVDELIEMIAKSLHFE